MNNIHVEDYSVNLANNASVNLLAAPKFSNWICHINGGTLRVRPLEGKEPNWFHRKMQHLILGFKWEKIDGQ